MIAAAFAAVVDMFVRLGQRWDDALPGCLEHAVDEHWLVALNGAREHRADAKGYLVPSFHVHVRYDGCTIALLSPTDGVFIVGTRDAPGQAEREFIKACKAASPRREPKPSVPQPQQMTLGGLDR